MAIVDQYGRPIKPAEVAQPQTARIELLYREYAHHPSRGLTPSKLARVLEDAERGDLIAQSDLFDDMEERDAHIHAELGKRRRAVLSAEMQIEPPRNADAAEKRATDLVNEIMEDLDVDEILLDMGDAIGKGFAPLEIEWQKLGGGRIPKLELVPQRWFQLPPNMPNTNELRLRNFTVEGEDLVPGGWLVHRHKARPGYIARASLGRILAWPYLFKNYSVRDLAEFLEIYGLPMRIGKYHSGATKEEKATLLRAVMSIGHSAAGVIPQGMEIDFQDAADGKSDPFLAMMDWCERSESKAIIGQVLSAEAKATGMGSGVANLQAEVRDDISRSDARQMGRSLSDLCYLIAVFNGAAIAPGRGPQVKLLTDDSDDMKTFADAVPALVNVGMQIPEDWAHDRLKIPKPESGQRVLQPAAQPQTAAASAALRSDPAAPAIEPPQDQIADALEREGEASMQAWIDKLRAIVDDAIAQEQTMDQLRDRFLAAFSDLPADQLTKVMQAGFAVANLSGRFDVAETHG